jgi:hypothetical protein
MSVCNLNKLLIPILCYLSQIQRDEALPLTHEKVRKDGENFSGFLQLNFGKTYNNSKNYLFTFFSNMRRRIYRHANFSSGKSKTTT